MYDISNKLKEMAENISNDTLLIILSDHGKDEEGQHINCNKDLTCSSFFFAYSKKKLANL
jgi:phosphopentomutase